MTRRLKLKSWRWIVPYLWAYYQQNAAGGSLHVVTDDGNTRDCDVDFCIRYAVEHDDLAGLWIAIRLREMPEQQREKLYGNYRLYQYGAPKPRPMRKDMDMGGTDAA